MLNVNEIRLGGRLTSDVKTMEGKNGAFANFRLAVKRSYGDVTDFFSITAFGKVAENLAKYTSKGSEVYVEATLSTYETEKDSKKVTRLDIIANNIQYVNIKKAEAEDNPTTEPVPETSTAPVTDSASEEVLPF